MKVVEKEYARRLRQEQGLPINEISKIVGVSKSSISLWVRDVPLSYEQKQVLLEKNPAYNAQHNGGQSRKECALKLRKQYQEEGKLMARSGDKEIIAVSMLYWAEGSKDRCSVKIANTDVHLLKWFLDMMVKHFGVDRKNVSMRTQWYSNNDVSFEDMQKYWISNLQLDESSFRKCSIDPINIYSQKKRKCKHPYGTCTISIHRTDIVQRLYGIIQEVIGVEKPEWIE